MGGFMVAAIGYEVTDALERYQNQHHVAGVSSFKLFLRYLESETSLPLSLARLEDSDGLSRMFLCCYVDSQIRVYNCEELVAMPVPPEFTRVKELLGIKGDLKRVFGPQGMIFSYDADGRIRMWRYKISHLTWFWSQWIGLHVRFNFFLQSSILNCNRHGCNVITGCN